MGNSCFHSVEVVATEDIKTFIVPLVLEEIKSKIVPEILNALQFTEANLKENSEEK